MRRNRLAYYVLFHIGATGRSGKSRPFPLDDEDNARERALRKAEAEAAELSQMGYVTRVVMGWCGV
jgi:hypothetical protein